MGMMGGGFMGGFGMIFWVLIVIGVVVLAVYGFRKTSEQNSQTKTEDTALDIVRKRYARGEISKEEYNRIRHDIL